MYKVRILVHEDGERLPILVDSQGMPFVEPNAFIFTKRGLAYSSLYRQLETIGLFHSWADALQPDLQDRIESGTLFSEAEVNGSLFNTLRQDRSPNQDAKRIVSQKVFNTRVVHLKRYLSWRFANHLLRLSQADPRFERTHIRQNGVMRWLDDMLLNVTSAENEIEKGLSSYQRESLLKAIAPAALANPWAGEFCKSRNQIVVLLMLLLGIRPSEVLGLRISDIRIGPISSVEIHRRPHDKADPRRKPPQVKRAGRVLEIDWDFAKIIDEYVTARRPQADRKHPKGTEYLIISDDGNPLSYDAVRAMFVSLRKAIPVLPRNFSPKTLRHTFSSDLQRTMKAAGIEEGRRREILQVLRGDTSVDSQDVYIKSAIREEAMILLKDRQKIFVEDIPF